MSIIGIKKKTKIKLPNPLTSEACNALGEEIQQRLVQGQLLLEMDAGRLSFIDSFGIGFLVKALKTVRALGGDLSVCNLRGSVLKLFLEVGLDKIISLQPKPLPPAQRRHLSECGLDTKPYLRFQFVRNIALFRMEGMMLHPAGPQQFNWMALRAMNTTNKFVLDLKDLAYLDSASVGEIVSINTVLKTSHGGICVCRLRDNIQELFQTLGLDNLIPVYNALEEAMNSWL